MRQSTTKEVVRSFLWGAMLLINGLLFLAFALFFLTKDWTPKPSFDRIPLAARSHSEFKRIEDQPVSAFRLKGETDDLFAKLRKREGLSLVLKGCTGCGVWLRGEYQEWMTGLELRAMATRSTVMSAYIWFYLGKLAQLIIAGTSGFLLYVLWRSRGGSLFSYFTLAIFTVPICSILVSFAMTWFEDIYTKTIPILNERSIGFIIFGIVTPFLTWPPIITLAKRRRIH